MSTTVIELENKDIVVKMSGQGPIGPRGQQGEPGPAGPSEWGVITGNISDQTDLQNALDAKANVGVSYTKTEDDALLAQKADADAVYTKTETDSLLADKADTDDVYSKSEVNTLLSGKADSDTVYTKTETDTLLDAKADVGDSYTKAEEDALLAVKANSADVYTKTETDTLLADKADADTVYTKTETDSLLSDKADSDSVYTKTEVDDALADKADSADVYTKDEMDDMLLDKAPVILNSASGSIASFSDGSPAPVTDLNVAIEPVQDLHGYDNPWPAGGGVNVMPTITSGTFSNRGVTVVVTDDGKMKVTGQVTSGTSARIDFTISEPYTKKSGYYIHFRNNVANSNVEFGVGKARGTIGQLNKILPITEDDEESSACYLYFATTAELNLTLQPSIEATSTVTDWTPYSNICPISGRTSATVTRTGVNIWDEQWAVGDIPAESGEFITTGAQCVCSKNFIPVKPNMQIYIHGGSATGSNLRGRYYRKDKSYIGVNPTMLFNQVTTIPSDCYFIKFTFQTTYGTTYLGDTSLNYPTSDHDYHVYQGTSVTIDLDGTRYGGVLNVLTGEMVVTKVFWTKNTSTMNNGESYPGWNNAGIRNILPIDQSKAMVGAISNISAVVKDASGQNYFAYNTIGNNDVIYLPMSVWNKTQTQWKADAIDVELVIPLATPLTVQLTPSQLSTLLGQNNIWADTGDVAVTYRADSKMYIDQSLQSQSNALKLMLTPNVETEMKASKNYTSGSIVIVNNDFIKLTSAVASGANLVIGSNCVKTTMAEWVASLTA